MAGKKIGDVVWVKHRDKPMKATVVYVSKSKGYVSIMHSDDIWSANEMYESEADCAGAIKGELRSRISKKRRELDSAFSELDELIDKLLKFDQRYPGEEPTP